MPPHNFDPNSTDAMLAKIMEQTKAIPTLFEKLEALELRLKAIESNFVYWKGYCIGIGAVGGFCITLLALLKK